MTANEPKAREGVQESNPQPSDRIRFHYIKSPWFHTTHADGAIGGPTPRGDIHIAFYAERLPIPNQTEHELKDGRVGPELVEQRVAREGIVRELTVDIVMDLPAAMSLQTWLADNIRKVQTRLDELNARSSDDE